MIRFVYIGDQIEEGAEQFAFFNTVTDKFINFDGEQVFDSVEDLESTLASFADDETSDRCRNLIEEVRNAQL